jgi:FkbM family methyltransferase
MYIILDENNNQIDTNYYESYEQYFANKYIMEDDCVLELGARFGSVSCAINEKLKCKTNQVSVEPDERVYNALELNKRNNNCEFHIIKGFISNKPLSLVNLEKYGGYATSSIENADTTIPSYTLNEIKQTYNLDFNVLVADCEGFLETFFDENPEMFNSLRLVIFEADGNCNYDKIRINLLIYGFKEVETAMDRFQNVWSK